ncbi:hypothetical protein D3C87_1248360 [compost metagenome]
MNTLFDDPNMAMHVAWDIARQTGRRVWRHAVENKYGATRWLVSFNSDASAALQEVTA